MHSYLVRFHVAGVGMIEESISAYNPLDAQHAVQMKYGKANVALYNIKQIS